MTALPIEERSAAGASVGFGLYQLWFPVTKDFTRVAWLRLTGKSRVDIVQFDNAQRFAHFSIDSVNTDLTAS